MHCRICMAAGKYTSAVYDSSLLCATQHFIIDRVVSPPELPAGCSQSARQLPPHCSAWQALTLIASHRYSEQLLWIGGGANHYQVNHYIGLHSPHAPPSTAAAR